jgi:hypothetical protein
MAFTGAYCVSRTTSGLNGLVLKLLQSIAREEFPTKVTVLPMIWVQPVLVAAPPAKMISPVGM